MCQATWQVHYKVNCGVRHGQDSCLLDICGHLALETVSPNGQYPAFAAGKHGLILPSKYLKCSSKPLSSCLAESHLLLPLERNCCFLCCGLLGYLSWGRWARSRKVGQPLCSPRLCKSQNKKCLWSCGIFWWIRQT